MKPMRYKGYSARIEYSDEDGCFVVAWPVSATCLRSTARALMKFGRHLRRHSISIWRPVPHGASYRISPTRANSSCALPLKYTRR